MKAWGYAAIVMSVLGTLVGGLRWAYTAGYEKRDNEARTEILDAVAEAVELEAAEWAKAVEAAEAQIIVEEKIVEKIRVVEREIPKVVETVRFECRNLGADYAGLLNDQVRAANNLPSPETPPGVDGGLPANE